MSKPENTAARVKHLRTKLHASQEEFAARLGFSRNYISMIEKGREPGSSFLLALEAFEKNKENTLPTEWPDDCRIREDSPPMLPTTASCQHVIEHLTKDLSPEKISTAITAVMQDQRMPPEDRRRIAQALSSALTHRLSSEHAAQTKRN